MKKRRYQKVKRAQQQEQMRDKIVAAAVALHEKMGPAHTTIKAIAEQAGVQRLTVYRYFPDENHLFQACTSTWFELNPPPDEVAWQHIANPLKRCRAALLAFYRYYRGTEKMWWVSYRDVEQVKALQAPMAQFESYLDKVAKGLAKAWQKTGEKRRQLHITLRHGLSFLTWQSLNNQKLSDKKMVSLLSSWLETSNLS